MGNRVISQKVSVVTGGAGFIGSHLCQALLAFNQRVYCIDNCITGSEKNISEFFDNPGFTFIRHDVIKDMPILHHVDYVFHLASPASVVDYQKYPEETALVNSVGTRNLLAFSKACHARFLLASTSEVYGDPKEHPQKETYWGNVNPLGIRACYDESKRFAEMLTMVYVRKYGIDARIVRIFNTYGPKMRRTDGRVISNFINQALAGTPITMYGTGKQTRSFCYVTDLVNGLIASMENPSARLEVINLGNPDEYSIRDLAQRIIFLTHSSSVITKYDLPLDDPEKRKPDITKATELLHWIPKVHLDEGLQKTIAYYKKSS